MRSRRFSSLRACFSTSSGIRASVDRLLELRDLGRALVALAELLLDRAHLLAQQVLAVGVADRLLGALVDLARELQHLDALREELEQLVEARLAGRSVSSSDCFSSARTSISAGDEVGELRRAVDVLERGAPFPRAPAAAAAGSRARAA